MTTRYRNPRIEAELNADAEVQEHEQIMEAEPVSVEDGQFKKRYGDLRREFNTRTEQYNEQIARLEQKVDELSKKGGMVPASEDEIKEFIDRYPQFSRVFQTMLDEKVQKATSKYELELGRLKEKEADNEAREAYLALKSLHPDLDKLLKQGFDFLKWLENQPSKVQAKIHDSLDVDEADLVLTAFKNKFKASSKSGGADDEDEDRTGAAKAVRGSKAAPTLSDTAGEYDYSESQIDKNKNNRKWIEENLDKIVAAQKKGRILMDLSGGAQ